MFLFGYKAVPALCKFLKIAHEYINMYVKINPPYIT